VIDLHAHILPGLDDGPADLDGAVALARAAVADGTRVLAATSHVDSTFGLRAADLTDARNAVVQRLAGEAVPLEIVQGGEVSPVRLPELGDEDLRALTLGDGPWILLECPFSPVASVMDLMVEDLQRRGFGVLLAHPERSPAFQREPARLARLIDGGALAQVTAGSRAGGFGSVVRRCGLELLQRGLVHVLASDAHDHRERPPVMSVAIAVLQRRFGDVAAHVEWMTERLPAAILAGASLPDAPALPRRRRLPRLRDALRA
jgi:protein-tyrosine phosphatase